MNMTILNQTVCYVTALGLWDAPNKKHKIHKMTVGDWLERILTPNDATASFYKNLRALKDKEARDRIKREDINLVMGAVSDTKSKSQDEIIEYSGLVMVDIDGADDVADMIARMKDSHLFLAGWRSCGGSGCHGIVVTSTKATSVKQFNRIAQYVFEGIEEQLGISTDDSSSTHVDPAEKKPLQGLAMSYDPEMGFMDHQAITWDIPASVLADEVAHSYTSTPLTWDGEHDKLIEHIDKLINKMYTLAKGERFKGVSSHCFTIGGYAAKLQPWQQNEIIQRCIQIYKEIDPNRKDHEKVVSSAINRGMSEPLSLPTKRYYKPIPDNAYPSPASGASTTCDEETGEITQICSRCTSKKVALYQFKDGSEVNLCNRCYHSIKASDRPVKIFDYPPPEKKSVSGTLVPWEKLANDLKSAYHWHISGREHNLTLRYCPKDNVEERIRIKLEHDDGLKLWREDGYHCIEVYINKCYEEIPLDENGAKPKPSMLMRETVALMAASQPLEEWDGFMGRPGIIPFRDGILEVEKIKDWSTASTRPYRPEDHFSVGQTLPINWIHPSLLTSGQDGLPARVIHNYGLIPEQEQTIYEMIGLCLIPHYFKQYIFLFSGSGWNGKTMLAKILHKVLGSDNVTSVVPQHLNKEHFSLSNLKGKLANIADDFPNDELKEFSEMKGLSGNSPYTARVKHKADVQFTNYATLVFICNEVPVCSINEEAWWRRIVPIELPKQFPPGHPDRIDNADKLIETMDLNDPALHYVIGRAVHSVWRMYHYHTELSWKPNEKETREIWDRLSNKLVPFIEAHCIRDESAKGISLQEFHAAFNKWWTRRATNRHRLLSHVGYREINKFMGYLGFNIEKASAYGTLGWTPHTRYWAGIRFKEESLVRDFIDPSDMLQEPSPALSAQPLL